MQQGADHMKKVVLLSAAASLAATAAFAEHHEKGEKKMHETPELTGVFMGEGFSATMAPQGVFAAADSESGVVFVIGKFGAKDGMVWFKDIMAPPNSSDEERACATENKGKYSYTMDGDTVTFALDEDPCPGRAEAIDGTTMTRWTPPAEE